MSEDKNEFSELKAENQLLKKKLDELILISESSLKSERIKNIILDISKTVHNTKNIEELSKSIHFNLKKILLVDNFFVALYDDKTDTYSFPYFVDEYDQPDESPINLKNTLTDYVRRTGSPLFADETIHRDLYAKKEVDYIGAYSSQWLGVPLKSDNSTIGVVAIQDYSQDANYTKEDLEILNFIANNISFLIEKKINDDKIREANEYLEQKVIQRTIELETLNKKLAIDNKRRKEAERVQNALYRISKSLKITDELEELYRVLHSIIKSLMPANNFYIAQIDETRELIYFPYYIDEFDDPPSPIPFDLNTLTSHIIKSESSLILNSETYLTFLDENQILIKGTIPKIWIGVPLIVKDICIGAMVVQDYHSNDTYSERDKEILTFVSNQVARTIELKKDEVQINNIMSELLRQKTELQETTKKLEASNNELKLSEKQLQKLVRDKDKFNSIIAHDLKNPLQSLLGTIDFLKEEYSEMEKSESEVFVNNIHKSTKTLYSLIENLLEWSRIQLGKFEANDEIVKISDLLNKIKDQLESSIKVKKINLRINIEDSSKILTDRNTLEIILRNLISNAIKFSYEGGEILIEHNISNEKIFISIQDYGTGISDEIQRKIFSDSETISTSGTKNEKGTGLGLLLCIELIEKLGGSIKLESKLNEGSNFIVQLPSKKVIKDSKMQ